MSNDSPTDNQQLDELKTTAFDRRMSIAKASLNIGRKWAASSASSIFLNKEQKEQKKQAFMQEQANYLAEEIGKLKGSIVKIGQMMALYGEHFLPPEVTEALHTLNNKTPALSWHAIEKQLQQQLGNKLDELTVDQQPLGTASLAQVHRAVRKSDGLEVVLKIQYPGVAEAIDSDMNLFRQLVKLTNIVPQTREFDEWFEEVRDMMHREVDYLMEAATTKRFAERLKDDPRYIVPQILDGYSNARVMCMTYEHGVRINSPVLLSLPQKRRNAIGEAALEIMIREIFEWGEMQTDPNFGNYFIRIGDGENVPDRIVLLDFGAIRGFDENLLKVAQGLILAGYAHNQTHMVNAMQGYAFFDKMPDSVKADMANVFLIATEPFSNPHTNPDLNANYLSGDTYIWKKSQLHARVINQMADSMASRYFSVPPKEFMFISRKFIGAYTFMTVIDAHTDVYKLIATYQ